VGNTSKQRNIAARRRLAELYARGVELRFDADGVHTGPFDAPPDDNTIAIWVAPPSPLHREQALRAASAAKARATMAAKRDADSDEALAAQAFLASMQLATLIDYVLQTSEVDRQSEAQREVRRADEWSDFTELQDSMREWDEAGNPETEEWADLIARDAEYGRQVTEEANRLRASAREALALLPREELERRGFDKRVELLGSQAFMIVFEREMLFYACRDDQDHSEMFFESSAELSESDMQVQEALLNAIGEFVEDPREAKNSPRVADGSEPSTLPDEPETSDPSTPLVSSE